MINGQIIKDIPLIPLEFHQQHQLKQLHLLLVEDQLNSAKGIQQLLRPLFASVTFAIGQQVALTLFRQQHFDLVMTDIELQDGNGLALIGQLRQIEPQLPVIVLTAFSRNDYLLHAANLQLDGYILKPLNFDKLNQALVKLLNRLQPLSPLIPLHHHCSYDPMLQQLEVDGKSIALGTKQRQLLELLLRRSPRAVSRKEMITHIWHEDHLSPSALKNLLLQLREQKTVLDFLFICH
ncbi:response regulator [Ectothiorhodospiraceae bacterium BW-2]|nr:response regulator [Ectothiorhodospiraceae bacterium BW-2]